MNRNMRLIFYSFFVGVQFLMSRPVFAAENDLALEIDAVFSKWDRQDTPGVAVAVIRDGQIIFSKGYGSAQLEYEVPIGRETVFHVASVSKQITAFALTLLEGEGTLSLEDEVRMHLSWMPKFDQVIHLKHLVYHTSGLRDQWWLLGLAGWSEGDIVSQAQLRSVISRQSALNFTPGTEYEYSNTGYTLMAEVVATASGSSFTEYVKSQIFDPLKMTHSQFYSDQEAIVRNRAYSYHQIDGTIRKSLLNFSNVGATGMFTTAEDLALWLDNFRHMQVGGVVATENMQQKGELVDGTELSYARGIFAGNYRGLNAIGHDGADAGFRSYVIWFTKPNTGIVVLSNFASINPAELGTNIADIVLSDDFPNPKPAAEIPQKIQGETITIDAEQLQHHVGTFEVEGGLTLQITLADNGLVAAANGQESPLVPISQTEFLLKQFNARIIFEPNGDKQTENLIFTLNDVPSKGTRVVQSEPPTVNLLQNYIGVYHSTELETEYHIAVVDNELRVRHQRRGSSIMVHKKQDHFTSSLLQDMIFDRDQSGRVIKMRVTAGEARNVVFERLWEDPVWNENLEPSSTD